MHFFFCDAVAWIGIWHPALHVQSSQMKGQYRQPDLLPTHDRVLWLPACFSAQLPSCWPHVPLLVLRLVSQIRARTLDCVECLAAWHMRSGSAEPFMYYGVAYMQNMGPDLVREAGIPKLV